MIIIAIVTRPFMGTIGCLVLFLMNGLKQTPMLVKPLKYFRMRRVAVFLDQQVVWTRRIMLKEVAYGRHWTVNMLIFTILAKATKLLITAKSGRILQPGQGMLLWYRCKKLCSIVPAIIMQALIQTYRISSEWSSLKASLPTSGLEVMRKCHH